MRELRWKTIFNVAYVSFHAVMSTLSVACLLLYANIDNAIFNFFQTFLLLMVTLSAARLFLHFYSRRYPLIVRDGNGFLTYRIADTFAAHLAIFLDRNLNFISYIIVAFSILSPETSQSHMDWAAKTVPFAYYLTAIWMTVYFCCLILPIPLIFICIISFPLTFVLLRRFFDIPMPQADAFNENHTNAAPPELLEKLWHYPFVPDASYVYKNPDNPAVSLQIPVEDAKCSICLGSYVAEEELRILVCKHHFHQTCADEWFKITATCPLCVRSIIPTSPDHPLTADVSSNV